MQESGPDFRWTVSVVSTQFGQSVPNSTTRGVVEWKGAIGFRTRDHQHNWGIADDAFIHSDFTARQTTFENHTDSWFTGYCRLFLQPPVPPKSESVLLPKQSSYPYESWGGGGGDFSVTLNAGMILGMICPQLSRGKGRPLEGH